MSRERGRVAVAGGILAALSLASATTLLAEEKEPLMPDGVPVVVLAFTRAGAVDDGVDAILTDLVLEALLNRHGVKALGPSDIMGLLTAEQQQQLLGCDDQVCRTELAGAVGAGRLIVGSVGKLGALTVVTVTLIDGVRAEVLSRSSERFQRVEEAVDTIGPMVDRLLGLAPTIVERPPLQLPPPTPPAGPAPEPVKVMEPREFCRIFERWRTRIFEAPWEAEMVSTRRLLLEDLLRTPFERDYNHKRSCIWDRSGWLDNGLRRLVIQAGSAEAAHDARRRFYEWREMSVGTERTQELWTLASQREAQGIARPTALPFEIADAVVPQAEESAELTRFLADYTAAAAVVGRAIDAVRGEDQAAFEALFGELVDGRSRTSPNNVYRSLRSSIEGGSNLDACPIWVIDYRTLERSAKSYADNGLLQGCMRMTKDDFARTDDIRLRRDGRRWVIDRW